MTAALFSLWGCKPFEPVHETSMFMRMHTAVKVTVVVKAPADLGPLWNAADSLLADWEKRFSQTHPASEVGALNSRAGEPVRVSPLLAEMLGTARAYGDTLEGGFDLTVLPLKDLWGLGEKSASREVPSARELLGLLEHVDFRKVAIDPSGPRVTVTDRNTRVDVGGIAKGFSLRALEALVKSFGYDDFLLEAGGDLLASGLRKDGKPWRVAIQHPRNKAVFLGGISLSGGSVVTSGDYERYWEKDGKRYHHIFDTETGYPCSKNRSLTVWGEDPVEADIFSTGLFCRDADAILEFVEKRARLECVVVDSSGTVRVSGGWNGRLKLLNTEPGA